MSTEYNINYEDERFKEVETQKQEAISENEKLYSGMIDSSDKYYQDQINASKDWADKQTQLQQEQTDFAIEQIEQQKDQAYCLLYIFVLTYPLTILAFRDPHGINFIDATCDLSLLVLLITKFISLVP